MKKKGVKERIIDAASALFYYDGYNQTGINKIIEEAGVAKASMYQHFRSKEDIAVAYLQRRHIYWMGLLEEAVATQPEGKEKLIASFDFLNSWLVEVGFRGCGFQNIITDIPAEHQKIKDQVRLHKNELHQWVKDQIATFETSSEKVLDLSNQILVLIEGAIMLSQIQQDAWPIGTAKKNCEQLLT
ncbi:TetR/AcrR family transcriptional regulator [Sediminicola luteus]|uniref:TetR family transcriptional regulator n=1 Tax=Sediminicola luteus TaxID=319238 RepID=A0A2A4G3R7_9FLAO|nr:TetR/AcrR family transcriptional regulator [Sediminicola luteus]PCE62628.1 TetR family transcriptional regulator [Sediminicola luteus]